MIIVSDQTATPQLPVSLMIDYFRGEITLPRPLPKPICGGWKTVQRADGVVEYVAVRWADLISSHETRIQVRSIQADKLSIDGNPAKFLQGHNLWGTDDLPALLWATLTAVLAQEGFTPSDVGLEAPAQLLGRLAVVRLDITGMAELESLAHVRDYLAAAAAGGRFGRRGRGHAWDQDSLTFGKGKSSSYTQAVLYAKGPEIRVHALPAAIVDYPGLTCWADRCLRLEARLGRNFLRSQGFRYPVTWSSADALSLWKHVMNNVEFSKVDSASVDVHKLPTHAQRTFLLWQSGIDPRANCKRPTFYRHRAQIKDALGVDIANPRPLRPVAEVVPIRRVIELRLAGRPAFADAVDAKLRAAGADYSPTAAA